jgi:hypothetical protein
MGYDYTMSIEEIKALPIAQKLQIMEALWEDLRERFEQSDILEEHKEILDARRRQVDSGSAKLLDWDKVKSTSGRS